MKVRALVLFSLLMSVLLAVDSWAAGGYGHGGSSSFPSSEELDDAMTAGPRHSNEPLYPWDTTHAPWVNVRPAVNARHERAEAPKFTRTDGKTFGPFQIGDKRFQTKPYPPDYPHMMTYPQSQFTPVDFEYFANANKQLIAGNLLFGPDPELLDDVQRRIRGSLGYLGWRPELISDKSELKEAEWLWPPVKIQEDNPTMLNMLYGVRKHLYQGTSFVLEQMHTANRPLVYHLEVPTFHNGVRHIMMTRVEGRVFTDLGYESPKSDFWLMQEIMLDKTRNPVHVLLGGMYLPKFAPKLLTEHGYIKPAFEHIIGHAH